MSQHHNTTSPLVPRLPLEFPPLPLASGEVLIDDEAREHPVSAVSLLVYTDCAAEPIEIALEEEHGGWWIPADVTIPPGSVHGCTANSPKA